MGRLKVKRHCGNFPVAPNTIKINIELVGDVMKFTTPDDTIITIVGNDPYMKNRTATKICYAIDTLLECIKLEKKPITK